MSERLSIETAKLAERLGDLLASAFPGNQGPVADGQSFLRSRLPVLGGEDKGEAEERLDRLAGLLGLSRHEIDLVLLAGMPEEHEGYAAVFRTVHPRGEPRPSTGLAAQLLMPDDQQRDSFLRLMQSSRAVSAGLVRLTGDVPFFEKTLELADGFWPVLHGFNIWPASLPGRDGPVTLWGLEEWLLSADASRARSAIEKKQTCTVLVTADSDEVAYQRGLALVKAAAREPYAFRVQGTMEADKLGTLKVHALARGLVPVLQLAPADGPAVPEPPKLDDFPDTAVLCGRTGVVGIRGARPVIGVQAERLTHFARTSMWTEAMSGLRESAPLLAARFPIEPSTAEEVAADLRLVETLDGGKPTLDDVAEAIRGRSTPALSGGIQLIRPRADWSQLVLPREREEMLRAAIARLDSQARVLDEWGFLKDRPGARGVRMLFSGPPGTGKTLATEVMAKALKVDLLFVDISRVVSKWIGETEKNLAALFDAAERSQAVLFFDEADALFGKRTEVSDAHDRYANLETAYLLARLERFEGLAILATNLRQNIDPAFLRRLEFVIDFNEPDREERFRMWKCHIPDSDLLDRDVNLHELAALYPIVGGVIRNAAVAAAFLAAADGTKICRGHFIRAIRREYEKAGRAFPGMPAGMAAC